MWKIQRAQSQAQVRRAPNYEKRQNAQLWSMKFIIAV